MNTTSNSQNNSSQSEPNYPHIIFSIARKDCTIAEFVTVFSADILELSYLQNVIPPESPFAAIRLSITALNLLLIVVPHFTNYKIYDCDNCPITGQRITSQWRPLVNNPTLTQVLPRLRVT